MMIFRPWAASITLHALALAIPMWMAGMAGSRPEAPIRMLIELTDAAPAGQPAAPRRPTPTRDKPKTAPQPKTVTAQAAAITREEPAAETDPAPAETAPSPGSQASAFQARSEFQAYVSALVRQIDEIKIYPRESIFREEEGRVVVSVHVDADGTIHESHVSEPCPYDSLNHAALETVQRLKKLPPIPGGHFEEVRLQIPMIYQLRRS